MVCMPGNGPLVIRVAGEGGTKTGNIYEDNDDEKN